MLHLSGFELYSRWVPLFFVDLSKKRLVLYQLPSDYSEPIPQKKTFKKSRFLM